MKIKKIRIENYKSIKELEFDVNMYCGSYTVMLVGVNESGKSNILRAMSYLDTPTDDFDYLYEHNQKDKDNKPVDLWFHLEFENKNTLIDEIGKYVEDEDDLLNFEVSNIVKNVYLEKGETIYDEAYEFDIKLLNDKEDTFIKKVVIPTQNSSGQLVNNEKIIVSKSQDDEEFKLLTKEVLEELLYDIIVKTIKKYEPSATYWTASEEYLIEDEDLIEFTKNIQSKKALRNIFLLAGYDTEEKILDVIEDISNGSIRSRLEDELQDALNAYIQKIWKHNIEVVIDITETGKFTLNIRDKGKKNKYDRLPISGRSEGARHFLSLILSLSIESRNKRRNNQLILIDEPEMHLHPSGVRELGKELLEIGKNNYLFVATHSPFLIDRRCKERNVIIEKDSCAYTIKKTITEGSLVDDEVLQRAFGINIYKDLLIPHSILVEGASDALILKKAFKKLKIDDLGITNGHGSNIVSVASLFNHDDIFVHVLVDDDPEGKQYKEKILKIGGIYSKENVFTLRDILGTVKNEATIEDLLNIDFVRNQFINFYKKKFKEDIKKDFYLDESEPFIAQIKLFLNKTGKIKKQEIKKVVDDFKKLLSEEFNPTEKGIRSDFKLLSEFILELEKKVRKK